MDLDDFKITIIPDLIEVPRLGRKTKINNIETTRDERTADGTLKRDILYTKVEIICTYDVIRESDLVILQSIYDIYAVDGIRPSVIYQKPGDTINTVTGVYPDPINYEYMTITEDNLYKGVRLRLVEE